MNLRCNLKNNIFQNSAKCSFKHLKATFKHRFKEKKILATQLPTLIIQVKKCKTRMSRQNQPKKMSVYFSEVIYNVENSLIEENSSIFNCTVYEFTAIKLIDNRLNLYILI